MASPHVAGAAALYVAQNGKDSNGDGNVDGDDVEFITQALLGDSLPNNTNPPQFTEDLD